jgi:hypothetical protein
VTHGVLDAVLLVFGIEVAASGLEIGWVAESFRVNVDSVLADGEILEVELDRELALLLLEGGGAGIFSGAGLERDDDFGLWLFGEGGDGEKAKSEGDDGLAHGTISNRVFL